MYPMAGVELEVREKVLLIVFSEPEKFNPLSAGTLNKIRQIVESYHDNPKPLLITGKGKLFSAGIDLSEVASSTSPEEAQKPFKALVETISVLLEYPAPTGVYLNGPAIAGGGEIALATDFIYANPKAWLQWPEVKWNIIAPLFLALSKKTGLPRLASLNMDAGKIPAEDAYKMGIVSGLLPSLDEALKAMEQVYNLYVSNKFAFRILLEETRSWKKTAVTEIAYKLVDAAASDELIERARRFLSKK